MSEEEKKAIEYLKENIKIDKENIEVCEVNDFYEEAEYISERVKNHEVILNLIEKQQKEIEIYKKKVDILENKVHYKICENCNKEYRTKRSDTKYCKECAKKVNNSNWYNSLTEEKKQERREKSKLAMRKYRARKEVENNVE